jgi:proton glutamate symport protein
VSLASKVLVGLALGVLTGVVFGEQVAFLGVVGRVFVLLLQMAVLPFVAVSLVAGIGGLTPRGARVLLRYAGGFLLLIWVVTLLVVLASPVAFPNWKVASFFSASLVQEREGFDFIGMYIPSNPFRSLSDGIVPAVVVFSGAFGVALMASPRKAVLIEALLGAQDALRGVTNAVVRLAPYGIFAIAAESAGTMAPEKLAGLQVYVVTYVVLSVVLAFWLLPGLVAAVTPFSYGQVVGPVRDALLTAFATGSLFIVLPLLADRARTLLAERGAGQEAGRQADVVVPIAFTLAGAHKLMVLVFVLYAGWQSGFPIPPGDYPEFAATGVFSFFASSAVALPFLLDLFRIPSDLFQLYLIVDSVIGGRFGALLGSVHIFSLALISACGAAGWVRLHARPLLVWGASSVAVTLLALGAIRAGFERFDRPYEGYREFVDRSFLLPTVPWRDRDEAPEPWPAGSGDALRRIRERGVLRVGYAPNRLPYAFRSEAGELVGFDVEMAHALARDLRVRVDFFRVDVDRMPALLDSGALDVVMTGLAITPERLEQMNFSTPYLEETLAFLVRDYRRDEFRTRDAVKSIPSLRLAVPSRGYYAEKIRAYLPDAEIAVVDSPRAFFRAEPGQYDALIYAAEAGSAWTLIYPEFTVAVPHPDVLRVPVGYATARNDPRMAEFIDAWILLKRNDDTIGRLFTYWFEGIDPTYRKRRWSVARNVWGWGAAEPEAAAPKAATLPAPTAEPPTTAPPAPAAPPSAPPAAEPPAAAPPPPEQSTQPAP